MNELYEESITRTELFLGALLLKVFEFFCIRLLNSTALSFDGVYLSIFSNLTIIIHLAFFIIISGMIARRMRMTGIPMIVSLLTIFEPLQLAMIVFLSCYKTRGEKMFPNVIQEIKKSDPWVLFLGGYGK